ncbi:hypothetical protein J2X13_000911 [Aminobacter aminovorans]|nr:hypothetical protein [Aminobacter aminovorans]MDR7220514.1 hypothetical protein [Aminobacter aminovorans]
MSARDESEHGRKRRHHNEWREFRLGRKRKIHQGSGCQKNRKKQECGTTVEFRFDRSQGGSSSDPMAGQQLRSSSQQGQVP